MADRSVLVTLRAEIGDFRRQMDAATKATEQVGKKSKESSTQATTAMGQLVQSASKNERAWTTTGTALLGVGAAAAAGAAVAIKSYADFDKQMSEVKAATHETADGMDLLREAALQAGADTQFSATEAAQAITELSKAGVATEDTLGGALAGSMALASAGGLDVASSAEIAATALTQFKLEGRDVGHVADLLAAGAGKAQGDVTDLAGALKQAGLVSSQMGLSLESTTGTLAAFAANGLIGSDAGTSLRTMLLALANPSKESARLMEELGISAYDLQGDFVGVESLAGQLQERLGGLTQAQRDQALAQIFGSDAVRAANVLYSEGADGIAEWTAMVDDSGYAAVTAATKMDNLAGDVEFLQGSLETALIKTGSAGNDALRELVQGATDAVDAYAGLPEPMQAIVLQGAVLVAGVGLIGGAFLTLAPRVLDTISGIRTLTDGNDKLAGRLGKTAKAAGVLGAAFALVQLGTAAIDDTNESVLSVAESTELLASKATGLQQINDQFAALQTGVTDSDLGFDSLEEGLDALANPSRLDRLNDTAANVLSIVGLPYDKGRPERQALVEQLESMGSGLAALVTSGNSEKAAAQFDLYAQAAKAAGMSQEELLEYLPAYRDALADAAAQEELAAAGGDGAAASFAGVATSADEAEDAVSALDDALSAIFARYFSVEEASDAYQSALHKLADAAKENGRELEGNSTKAIANRDAMRGAVDAAYEQVRAMAEQGASAEELTAKTAELRQQFVDQAVAQGYSREQVERYAAAYDEIPNAVTTTLQATGLVQAATDAERLLANLKKINGTTVKATISVSETMGTTVQRGNFAGRVLERAAGGSVIGPGTGTSDSIPALLSNGEHVWTAEEVVAAGGHQAVVAMRERVLGRGKPIAAFATGGAVGGVQRFAAGGQVKADAGVSALLLKQLVSGPDTSTVSAARGQDSLAAAALAAAEADLALLKSVGEQAVAALDAQQDARMEALKARNDETQRLLAEANDAELFALKRANDDALDVLKQRHDDALDALKQRNSDAFDALKQGNDDEMVGLKDRQENALAALRKRTKDEKQIRALQQAQEAEERAWRRARDEEEAAASRQHKEQEAGLAQSFRDEEARASRAAEDQERAATREREETERKAKEAASAREVARAKADAERLARAKAEAAERVAAAEAKVTAAREAQAAASERLREEETKLAKIRADALALAEQVSGAVTGGFNLGDLLSGGGSASAVKAAVDKQVARAKELDAAVRELMGQGLDGALVDQITSQGAKGLDITRRLLAAGPGTVAGLNAGLKEITAVGNGLGSYVSSDRYSPALAAQGANVAAAQAAYAQATALLERALDVAEAANGDVYIDGQKVTDAVNRRNSLTAYRTVTV